jgi:hypothetical protein
VPRVSVITSLNSSINDIAILSNYNLGSKSLDAKYQYMISEVIMLRLFAILEATISEVAFKLACGAPYRNGNIPLVLRPCRSIQDAHSTMLNYNRPRALQYHRWTKASFIRESIEHVLDVTDRFYVNVQNHGTLINEMRIVRNHIAHNSATTRNEYNQLLTRLYGGNPRLTVGSFLTSTSRNPLANIDRYIASTRIILNDITHG